MLIFQLQNLAARNFVLGFLGNMVYMGYKVYKKEIAVTSITLREAGFRGMVIGVITSVLTILQYCVYYN